MMKFIIGAAAALLLYSVIGTGERVDEIKARAPEDIAARNWEIMRYEGYEYGSFWNHGGKVWYHVRNKDNHNIQYRVYITLWGGELQYRYGAPEKVERFDVNINGG